MLVGTQLQRRCGFEFALGERALAVRRRGELDAHCVGRSFGSSKLTYEEDVWMIDGVMRMVCNCLVGVGLRSRVVFCRLALGGGVDAAFTLVAMWGCYTIFIARRWTEYFLKRVKLNVLQIYCRFKISRDLQVSGYQYMSSWIQHLTCYGNYMQKSYTFRNATSRGRRKLAQNICFLGLTSRTL